jgi:predicted nucleotidyltransferase
MERIKGIDTEIFEFITRYKSMLLENCPNKIIGIYLFGSLAYGGFDKNRSDIDIVVITKILLKGLELETIKKIHKKLENINQKWSKRFEASYTPIDTLKENNPPKDPRPYYGEIFYDEATYGNEWLINNYLLWNYGIAIYGPEFKTLINKPISIEEVQEACIKDFYKEWKPKINDNEWLSNSHYQSYIVLNICRILYTVNKMELANKQKSCEWVKNNYSVWENLIKEAEVWNYDKKMDRKEEVNNFIKFADKIIEEWNDKSKKIESKSNSA